MRSKTCYWLGFGGMVGLTAIAILLLWVLRQHRRRMQPLVLLVDSGQPSAIDRHGVASPEAWVARRRQMRSLG